MKHSKFAFLFLLTLLFSTKVFADEADKNATPDRLESSATLDFNGDNNHDKGAGLNSDIGLNSEYHMTGGVSSVKNSGTTPFTTTDVNLGFGADPSKKIAWSAGIDSSNATRLFTINTLNGELFWNPNEKWAVHFIPGLRRVKTFANDGSEYDYRSTYLTSGATYYGLKNWHFKGELTMATFHRTRGEQSFAQLSPQSKAAFANARSQAITELSSNIFTLEFGYTFKIVELSLEDTSTTSAKQFQVLDSNGKPSRVRTNTVTLKSVWFVADNWDLGVNLANCTSKPIVTGQSGVIRSADANVTYYW